MCMLVNRVKDEIASELVHHLYTQITSVDSLLRGASNLFGVFCLFGVGLFYELHTPPRRGEISFVGILVF